MHHGHQWGTVCQQGWDLEDAAVVCRELNCGFVLDIPSGARFGRAGGEVLWRDVKCSGDEFALDLCERTLNDDVCTHSEDAGVECTGTRLFERFILLNLCVCSCLFIILSLIRKTSSTHLVNSVTLLCLLDWRSRSLQMHCPVLAVCH